ncbi:MAG: hypothetical protein E7057_09640 [Lentisphaerae bacterium]|nr:hypothetical protein [Lentisphaerota bacterium]
MLSKTQQEQFLAKAQKLAPQLKYRTVDADAVITPVKDKSVWQDYRMKKGDLAGFLKDNDFANGSSFIVSMPETVVGQAAFSVDFCKGYADSPSRIQITIGELPQEVVNADMPYNGTLNGSWLQKEIINIDDLPCDVILPRRYSGKYIRFDMLNVPGSLKFSNIRFITCGAEDFMPPPPEHLPELLKKIDQASIRTLRNCMQLSFEDGPKRDRRLWLGDLRLQAMVNKVTYRRFDIVARCLYLFAGTLLDDGEVCGCVMERPAPRRGCHTHDYAMLFPIVLKEHCSWSGDLAIGEELFDLACHQMKLMERFFTDGLFTGVNDPWTSWFFVDHDLELDRQAAMQGHAVAAYRALAELAAMLGKHEQQTKFAAKADTLAAVAREKLYDPVSGVVVSGKERQISYASQIWMIISGVLTPEEGRKALLAVENTPAALRPSSPYMFHYLLEAWDICGDEKHLLELLTDYYGSMINNGADTFWEVYRPDEPFFSPYNDVRMNSACHAWSGTAAYFLRKGN